jgi:hypothetical protein
MIYDPQPDIGIWDGYYAEWELSRYYFVSGA